MGSSQSRSAKKHYHPSSEKQFTEPELQSRRGKNQVVPSSNDSGYAGSENEGMSSNSSVSWEKPNLASLMSLDMGELRITPKEQKKFNQLRITVPNTEWNRGRKLDLRSERHPPAMPNPELSKEWRKFNWGQKGELLTRLEMFFPCNPNVASIKILVAGQVGAGKSSFINSVNSAFQGQINCEALADATSGGSHSFTERLQPFRIRNADRDLPYEICDVMGLEPEQLSGCHAEDIISSIYGHVKDEYQFKHKVPLSHGDEHYKKDPSMADKAFCLVYIVDASTVQFTDEKLTEKLRIIRNKISEAGIPQVVVMTKVDNACPLVRDDLRKIYFSKRIKEKMEMCSGNIGVPMSCIFPVKNYCYEIDTEDDVDILILKAFDQIVYSADARLRRHTSN